MVSSIAIYCLHTVKWFQVLLCNSNNLTSILYLHAFIDIHDMQEISLSVISFLNGLELICLHTGIAIVSIQLNGFIYCYLNINDSLQHYSFVCAQLNGFKYH